MLKAKVDIARRARRVLANLLGWRRPKKRLGSARLGPELPWHPDLAPGIPGEWPTPAAIERRTGARRAS